VAPSTPAGRVLTATALALGAELQWVEPIEGAGLLANNLALARAALTRLGQDGVRSPARAMRLGGRDLPKLVALGASLPGRLEALNVERPDLASENGFRRTTRVVLDGAHVGFAVTAAIDELRRNPTHALDPVVLLALGADKDADDFVRRLNAVASCVICTRLHGDRPSWGAGELARICAHQGIHCESIDDPLKGLARCFELVPDDSWILVTGSLYLAGVVRTELHQLHLSAPLMRLIPAQANPE
jgi:folylpolyglutamate synthase/dihydropteroate synthase